MSEIPLCDLKKQYQTIRDEVLSIIDKVCLESAFIKGPYVKTFEKEFTQAHRSHYGVGCSNGTSALSLSLEALGIGKGDEVILPSHTFMATAEAICHVGAVPVFCDIKPNDYTIDPLDIENKITQKTKAIIPVHIYGTPCNMDEITTIAKNNTLKIIEDCAQAHLAKYKEKYVGTFGDAGTFSFYPGKNLGAYGDAGFILCQELTIEEKLRRLIDHGRLIGKYDHEIIGYNERLDALQAAILSIKLKYLDKWTGRRQSIASIYDQFLKPKGFKVIEPDKGKTAVYHVYNVEVQNRSEIQKKLKSLGINTGIHYPEPIHKMKSFSEYNNISLPITEKISEKIMSLPIYPELSDSEIEFILNSFVSAS